MNKKIMIILFAFTFVTLQVMPLVDGDKITTNQNSTNQKEYVVLTQQKNNTFIIITPKDLLAGLEPLKMHKEQFGIHTKIITLEQIYNGTYFPKMGRDHAESIKYFIKNAIENWNSSYVLLVGGKEKTPVRHSNIYSLDFPKKENKKIPASYGARSTYGNDSWTFISDLYYSDIYNQNGSFCSWDDNNNSIFGEINDTTNIDRVDLYPDISIGRVLCNNLSELTITVNKIVNYEKLKCSDDWFKRVILCGGDTNPTVKEIIFKLIPFHKRVRIAFEGEYLGDQIAKILKDFKAKKLYATGFLRLRAKFLTIENINRELNKGAGFILFAGHGDYYTWKTHFPFYKMGVLPRPIGYRIDDIYSLTNEDKLPFAVFSSCLCGDFDNVSNPLAWEFVRYEQGGAIASLACTAKAFGAQSTLCTETLNGRLAIGVFKSYSKGVGFAGDLWKGSLVDYLNDENALYLGNYTGYCWANYLTLEQWILLGDPTLKIGGYD